MFRVYSKAAVEQSAAAFAHAQVAFPNYTCVHSSPPRVVYHCYITQSITNTFQHQVHVFVDGATAAPAITHAAPGPQCLGWKHLCALAARAAVVVVEEMPVPPERGWVQALERHLQGTQTGLVAVDTACTMPMAVVNQRYEKCVGGG